MTFLSAQVPVFKEPHHRTVLYTNQFRIFDVNIPPGATSLEHLHDRDMASVAISGATTRAKPAGGDWSAPRARPVGNMNVTQYTGAAAAHTVENVDKVPYQLIAVENVRESGWTSPSPLKTPGTKLNQEARAFYLYDVRLDASTPETTHEHQLPAITVLVSGVIENQGDGGTEPFRLQQPGRWLYTPMATPHTLRVPPGSTAHAVEIEVR